MNLFHSPAFWSVLIALFSISATMTLAAMIGAAARGPREDSGSPEMPYMPRPVVKQKSLKDRLEQRKRMSPPKPKREPAWRVVVPEDKIRRMHWADEADTEATHG